MQRLTKLFTNKKTHKTKYYINEFLWSKLTPKTYKLAYKNKAYKSLKNEKIAKQVFDRVNYYNKLTKKIPKPKAKLSKVKNKDSLTIFAKDIFKINCSSTYKYDLNHYLSFFNKNLTISCSMGDVTHVPKEPSIVKSRPIIPNDKNKNSIVMNLDKIRHFNFVKDKVPFKDKINKLIWRGAAHQKHRIDFLKKYHKHKLCNVAQVANKNEIAYGKYLSIEEQLKFKFILCIEGNDVATNLKWAMSSNSLCFMTKPKYETWFMEGLLKPGFHYVELKDDYSDLEEKIKFYSTNIDEAEIIIRNANKHTAIFQNKRHEDLISLLVLEKYFDLTKQINSKYSNLWSS
jgi:hypothetical protein